MNSQNLQQTCFYYLMISILMFSFNWKKKQGCSRKTSMNRKLGCKIWLISKKHSMKQFNYSIFLIGFCTMELIWTKMVNWSTTMNNKVSFSVKSTLFVKTLLEILAFTCLGLHSLKMGYILSRKQKNWNPKIIYKIFSLVVSSF